MKYNRSANHELQIEKFAAKSPKRRPIHASLQPSRYSVSHRRPQRNGVLPRIKYDNI